MSTKQAPKSFPSRPRAPPTKPEPVVLPARPTAQVSPPLTDSVARTTETFRKRRTGLWAIGVAVIVGAGAILGSQLKSTQQAKERRVTLENEESTGQGEPATKETNQVPQRDTSRNTPRVLGLDSVVKDVDLNQKQISYLQDRRGVLMRQKFDLEQKIQRVREKKEREIRVEKRRGPDVDNQGGV